MNDVHSVDQQDMTQAYFVLARYADAQYQSTSAHLSSPTIEAKKQIMLKLKVSNSHKQ